MEDLFGIKVSAEMFFYLMVSFGFFTGIILMISPEAFETLHKALQKEYGLKVRLVPKIEDKFIDVIDRTVIRNRNIAGIIISISSFVLLLLYK